LCLASLACHSAEFHPKYAAGEIDLYDDLFTVNVDGSRIVAGGYWGTIFVSEDAGRTWTKSETHTKRLIYKVSIAEGGKGWAVGQVGTILRTEDGGRTWKPQANPKEKEATNLFGIQALDGNTAWVVGEWGTRLFTSDGGISWEDHSLTIDETHPQFPWLPVSDQERIRKGQKVFEDVTLNDVFCRPPPSHSCWMIGEFGYIFRSDNGGQNWENASIEEGVRLDRIDLAYNEVDLLETHVAGIEGFAKSILDESHLNVAIEAFGSAKEVADMARPDDPTPFFELLEARTQSVRAVVEKAGILSDRVRLRGSPPWDYEDFLEDDPDFLKRYLVGRTADRPGISVKLAQNPFLFTIRFRDEEHGLISGLGGLVLVSEDGGRNWRYQKIDRKQALFAVDAIPGKAITVGEKGLARVSTDGGTTWSQPGMGFPTIFTFMRDIQFAEDARTGYIVGERGMVLKTEDAGETWTQVLPPEDRRRG
jgi:photosystem II stability/assembly factor-like uncharacterized protein